MDKLRQWVALTLVAALVVLTGGWLLLVSPQRTQAAELRDQAAVQQSTNAQLATQLEVLRAKAEGLPRQEADLAEIAARIPDGPDLPHLLRALAAAGRSAGAEVVAVTPGAPQPVVPPAPAAPAPAAPAPAAPAAAAPAPAAAPVPAPGLSEISLAIEVAGDFHEIEQFVAELEDLPRALRITALSLAPGASPTDEQGSTALEDGRSLRASITGSVFVDAAAAAPAAPAPPVPVGAAAPVDGSTDQTTAPAS